MRSPLSLMLPLITQPALCHAEAQHATAIATMLAPTTVRILVFQMLVGLSALIASTPFSCLRAWPPRVSVATARERPFPNGSVRNSARR
jgi:hypothetical protein